MLVLFREADGATPFLHWFAGLSARAQLRCRARLQLLHQQGHLLRRPAADYLRDGIYELRVRTGRVQYRVLYFFHGKLAVLSHGFTKPGAGVPPVEIDRALRRKRMFESNPWQHMHEEII